MTDTQVIVEEHQAGVPASPPPVASKSRWGRLWARTQFGLCVVIVSGDWLTCCGLPTRVRLCRPASLHPITGAMFA